jgi:hypothetical protein
MPKNTTRKNTKQTKQVAEKPKADATAPANEDEWGFGSILVKSTPNTTRSKKKTPEPKPEPIPEPIPEWEQVGMTEEDYKAMRERTAKQMLEWQIENFNRNMLADFDTIAYWESRIETLEKSRERYNKKRGWSAEDVAAVEEIDAEIQECENEIARIEAYDDYDYEYGQPIAAY